MYNGNDSNRVRSILYNLQVQLLISSAALVIDIGFVLWFHGCSGLFFLVTHSCGCEIAVTFPVIVRVKQEILVDFLFRAFVPPCERQLMKSL